MSEKREGLVWSGGDVALDATQHEVKMELEGLRDDIVIRRCHLRKTVGEGMFFEGVRNFLGWRRRRRSRGLGGGLYVHGGVGRGKTMLMDMFYEGVPGEVGKRRFHYHDFMGKVHDAFKGVRQEGEEGVVMGLAVDRVLGRDCDLLCLDEMEVLDITDAMIICRVFGEIMARGITLVFTSNKAPHELYKDGLQRELFVPFIEMLDGYVEVVDLGLGHDYRLGMEGGEKLCFVAGEEEGVRRVYEGWQEEEGEESLEIGLSSRGRFLRAKERKGRKVWLRFEDVCGDVLGSRDYIKVSRAFDRIVLEGVPLMGEVGVDRVRRFVMLIDVLYEERVVLALVLWGGLSLEETMAYSGEDYYGLDRAYSRLEEMVMGYGVKVLR